MSRRTGNFFPQQPGDPLPLEQVCQRTVRFEELDPLRIVWHGRYASYLEDGRVAFGERYGVNYSDFRDAGLVVPLAEWHLFYKKPLELNDRVTITTRLHWSRGARINFSYELSTPEKGVTATGYTIQLFLDTVGTVQIVPPPFWDRFLTRWEQGHPEPAKPV
jgi:acyl-CoA thioester hydrolase